MPAQFTYGMSPNIGSTATRSVNSFDIGKNTGNLAFTYAVRQLIMGTHFPTSTDPSLIEKAGGVAVFPAANMIGAHVDQKNRSVQLAKLSKTRFVALGLGAQSDLENTIPELPQGTIEWLKEIKRLSPSSAPNIGVRGKFTKSVLDHYGFGDRATVLGCPSLFINPNPNVGKLIERRVGRLKRVAVVAGQSIPEFGNLERSLINIVTETIGAYIVQHPQDKLLLARGELGSLSKESILKVKKELLPDSSLESFLDWMQAFSISFYNINAWMEYYRNFDLVIGMRIHGVAIALQAGIPGICIVIDSRTLELCEIMKIPYIDARDYTCGLSLKDLQDLVQFDGAAYDRNRAALGQKHISFFKENGLVAPPYLERIANHD